MYFRICFRPAQDQTESAYAPSFSSPSAATGRAMAVVTVVALAAAIAGGTFPLALSAAASAFTVRAVTAIYVPHNRIAHAIAVPAVTRTVAVITFRLSVKAIIIGACTKTIAIGTLTGISTGSALYLS